MSVLPPAITNTTTTSTISSTSSSTSPSLLHDAELRAIPPGHSAVAEV